MYSIRYFELNEEGNNILFNLNLGEEQTADSQMKYNDEHICTKIKYLGCSEHSNYKKYLITCNKPVNISGYYKNEYIEYYITDANIEMYLSIDSAHMFIPIHIKQELRSMLCL